MCVCVVRESKLDTVRIRGYMSDMSRGVRVYDSAIPPLDTIKSSSSSADISQERRREGTGRQVDKRNPSLPLWHSFLLCGIPASFDVNVFSIMKRFRDVNSAKPTKPSASQHLCTAVPLPLWRFCLVNLSGKTRTSVHSNHPSVRNVPNAVLSHSLEIACSPGVPHSFALSAEK